MNLADIWDDALVRLGSSIGGADTGIWFRDVRPVGLQADGTMVLSAPSSLIVDWIGENYEKHLIAALSRARGAPTGVRLQLGQATASWNEPAPTRSDTPEPPAFEPLHVQPEPATEPPRVTPPPPPTAPPAASSGPDRVPDRATAVNVNPWQSFDNYIVGSSNRFAHAAAQGVAQAPGDRYNPLFIYGDTGVGKTHLMHAIGNDIHASQPHLRIVYTTAEQLANRIIDAIMKRKMDIVRNEIRNMCNVLMIDDIQFIQGKERTQHEFFHTFEHLLQNGGQVVVTSDLPPNELKGLERRLVTRFEGGMLADIQPPDRETRLAILYEEARTRGMDIPRDVAISMIDHAGGSVRELKGLVTKLRLIASLDKVPITMDLVQDKLPELMQRTKEPIHVHTIIETIARYHNLTVAALIGKQRNKQVVKPRHIAIYLARELTKMSYPDLGRAFGNRDHSTIRHAHLKVKDSIDGNADLQHQLRLFENMVQPR